MNYSKKRYITYVLLTIFIMGIPFIKVNGNHLLLLSFEKLEFHFLGFSFNVNELFIMPFLLMFLFIGIFAVTSILGRVWCGWACPQTIFRTIYRDLIESTILDLKRIKNKQKKIDYSKKSNLLKKYLGLVLWFIITLIIASNFLWYFVPPEDFFAYLQNPTEHSLLVIFVLSIALFLFYDIVFMKENFCLFVCPYSKVQSVLYDNDTKQVVYDLNRGGKIYEKGEKTIFNIKQWSENQECTTCEACVKICPTNIDIRKGMQAECINCLECVDACDTVMKKLKKENLIHWGSTNKVLNKLNISILNKRNLAYFISLILCIIFAISMATQKEYFIININKTTQLYSIKSPTNVQNNYIFTIQNRLEKEYTFNIKVQENKKFEIIDFKPFKLEPNQRVKKIIKIQTKEKLLLSNKKDTPLNIKVNIYTKENQKYIFTKELSFVYPRNDLLK